MPLHALALSVLLPLTEIVSAMSWVQPVSLLLPV